MAERELEGAPRRVISAVALAASAWHVYVLFFHPIDPLMMRAIHLGFIMTLGFLLWPALKSSPARRVSAFDLLLVACALGIVGYIYVEFDALVFRAGVMPTRPDIVIGLVLIYLIIELARRTTGWTLPIICIAFILYAVFGGQLPGLLGHPGYSLERTVSFLFSTEGIYTIPLGVSATYVFLFILFGAFLHSSGAGNTIIELAKGLAGGTRGGPAKVAIIASSLFGTMSGAAVANVAVTGVFTIPLMKRTGYPSHFAGAVESVASTGGQITPPVMGAAAFLMAEITGVPYAQIVLAGIIPALLFYTGLYFMVDFEAVKRGLYGLPRDQLPSLRGVVVSRGHLLLPIVVLFYYLIIAQVSPLRAAVWATLSVGLFSLLRRDTWMRPSAIVEALINGPQGVVTVAVTCAASGVVIGVMLLTGLGHRFAVMLIAFSGGELLPALLLAMLVALILGMGLPPVAAYAITGTAIAPALVQLGVPVLAAHMFVFFFSAISVITPPVAIAAFAAAAIARSNMWTVGITAFRIGIAAYLVPYMFVYGPALLMLGPWWQILLVTTTAVTGVACLAGSVQGWFVKPLFLPLRGVLLVAALALVVPSILTDTIGLGAIAIFSTLAYLGIGVRKDLPRVERAPGS